MPLQEFILKSEDESNDLAVKIANRIKLGSIITFSGGLGSGKTFFCRRIIKQLCGESTNVTSPTFNLLQIYQTQNFDIYHFDLYRLKHQNEIYELGIEEAFSNNVCLIEWPEIINDILPKETISITISIVDNTTRLITIKGMGI